jgi:uncharacterized protein (TIRG00374 family)
MGQTLRIVVGVVISILFLFWARSLVGNLGNAVTTLGNANYLYVVPALVVYFAGVWLRAARWHFLLRPVKSIKTSTLFPIVVIGYMANDVLPARLGEVVRAYVLGEQEGVPKTTALATILVERLFDGISMLLFVAAVGLIVPLNDRLSAVVRIATIIFIGALIFLVAVGACRQRAIAAIEAIERFLPAPLKGKVGQGADRFLEGLGGLQNGGLAAAILGLSLGAWLCEATMYFLISLGFGLGLGIAAYVLTTAVANLGAMIPAAPGYIGTFEAFALLALGLFTTDLSAAGAYVVVVHLALLGPVSLLGFFFLLRTGLTLRNLGQRASELTSTKGDRS